jgi:RimJ/RimL family protein N-acetyltransferase
MQKNKKFIEGKRIYLREVRLSDVNNNYYSWLNDPEVNLFLETKYFPRSIENILNYVKEMDGNPNEIFFAICLNDNNEHIGNIKLGPINWIHRFADISLIIGEKDYWGKGIASEAILELSTFAFSILNLHKLRAGCYSENIGSKRAFEKVGFKIEGVLKKQWLCQHIYQDEIMLGLTVDEYLANKDSDNFSS